MVFGSRVRLLGRNVERAWLRRILGRCFAAVVFVILRLPVYDTQCGAKLFRLTPTLREIFAAPFTTRWIFDVEIIARLIALRRREGGPEPAECIYELPLHIWRHVGGSKVRLADFGRVATDLWRVQRFLRRARAPSR
jgi:hypothetical protein